MAKRDLPYPEVLPEIDPRWKTGDVIGLARAIHAERAFERLPLLADALMDAGCADDAILDHLLGHARVCPVCAGQKVFEAYDRPGTQGITCRHCRGVGTVRDDPRHRKSWATAEPCGCWERQCWLVNHILGEAQPLRALVPYADGRVSAEDAEATAVNPGDWFGMTWLVTVSDCFDPPLYVVEAANPGEAEDVFIESEWGEAARISEADLTDYRDLREVDAEGRWTGAYTCSFTGNGMPYDTEHIQVTGRETRDGRLPFDCLYHGPGLPPAGVDPRAYEARAVCVECGREFFPTVHQNRIDNTDFCSAECSSLSAFGAADELPEAEEGFEVR